jgi:creatinine amidohydrolase
VAKANIARMAWPEVKEAVERKAVVLIPLASIEPSGRHSVMGGEIFIADYFAEGVAAKTGSVCLPSMPFGYAPSFMGFPGAVTLKTSTLAAVLEDVCLSMIHHGFDHLMIVDNHSGNEAVVEQVARKMRRDTGVLLANVLLPPVMVAVCQDLYPDLKAVHGHGGEPGVSARLFLCPDDMRLDLAVKTEIVPFQGMKVSGTSVRHAGASWTLFLDNHETNPSGGSGYPFDASAEKGKIIMERMVEYGAAIVETFKKVPTKG